MRLGVCKDRKVEAGHWWDNKAVICRMGHAVGDVAYVSYKGMPFDLSRCELEDQTSARLHERLRQRADTTAGSQPLLNEWPRRFLR